MNIIVYYDKKSMAILDFFPAHLPEERKDVIRHMWGQEIPRKILLALAAEDTLTAPLIKERIGHSMSTLHENIARLADAKLITSTMIYKGNKQKVLSSNILCVSKNTPLTERITRFLNQGLWVDSKRGRAVIEFLDKHPGQYFDVHEISVKTSIPVDEVETLLENWDSQITRAFSDFLKKRPFEKKVLYRSSK